MTQKAPGKSYRKGLSLIELNGMFPDDAAAERWYTQIRWPHGAFCPYCGSFDVQCNIKHKTMTHRCRDCPTRPFFSLKTGTVMQGSKLGYQVWAIATYLITTNIKGVSSMKLHRDVKVTQKTAWHLAHRLREGLKNNTGFFFGPVEVDETYIGGKEGNKHESKKLHAGRGAVGKVAVVGAKDRQTNQVSAHVVEGTDKETLQGFVAEQTDHEATIYTDEHAAYQGLQQPHETVRHSVGEGFVRLAVDSRQFDHERHSQLSRIPVSVGNHRASSLALSSLQIELS